MYLKKRLEMLGLGILICFSFILTEKTSTMIKDNDEIMTSIKERQLEFEYDSVDAKIVNDEIIPGISGKIIDIEESYQAMKQVGIYKDNLMVFKYISPAISINDNYDKYIVSGNTSKKQVSIIFKIDNDQNIDNIVNILNNKEIPANFFVNYEWSKNNVDTIKNISTKGHVIGKLESNKDTAQLLQSIIKINTSQKQYYCYSEEKNEELLNNCSNNKEYTILPSLVIDNSLLSNVMNNIKSGSIISITVNKYTLKELSNTVDYINSKGFKIVNLDVLLEE